MSDFKGKRIVITGATRGVGYESAKLFLAAGAQVLGTGRNVERLERVSSQLAQKGRFIPCAVDFDHPGSPEVLAKAVQDAWPALDYLINNAAVQTYKNDWFDEGLDMLNNQWRCNVFAPHELIYRLVPMLKKGVEPRIVNVGSGAGNRESLQTAHDMPTYRLTKYALGGMTMLWANQLKGKVAVNVLDPGWLKTDLGGPDAPGEPEDGGRRMVEICSLPWVETGKFYYGAEEISF